MKGALFTPEERESMYFETINYYVNLSHKLQRSIHIIFLENSGWNLNAFSQKIKPSPYCKIDYISLDPNYFDQTRGKSYNELLMMQLAISNNEIIKGRKQFIKLTGRIPLLNIASILAELEHRGGETLDFFGDCKDHNLYDYSGMKINGHAGESRFYAMSIDFWNSHFKDCYNQLNDYEGRSIEWFLLNLKRKTNGQHGIIWRLRTQPHFGGKGAHYIGKGIAFFHSTDNNSPALTLKRYVRQLCRWLLPWWWC